MPRSSSTRLVGAWLLPLLAACAPAPSPLPPRLLPLGDLTGVWDLVRSEVDESGDERTERQEWQLHQDGGSLIGFWNRSVTWVSMDGRPFACNGRTRCARSSRYLFEGAASRESRSTARLQVTEAIPDASPCASEERPVRTCRLVRVRESELAVDCGGGWQHLGKRVDVPVPLELARRRKGTLTGVWIWHLRSVDSEGDTEIETETWQLQQRGPALEGSYERVVMVRSGDGRRFQCNQGVQYTSRARFRVRGAVEGRHVSLEEVGFSTAPSPCENGWRSLDRYQGTVDEGADLITLSWGRGAQLLYRRY